MKNMAILGLFSFLAGCSSTGTPIPQMDTDKAIPPYLWSDHKQLEITVSACALKGYSALKALGFTSVVQNGNYAYGNFHSTSAAVKCVANKSNSFVYIAVAGPEKKIVEKLRNELVWKM